MLVDLASEQRICIMTGDNVISQFITTIKRTVPSTVTSYSWTWEANLGAVVCSLVTVEFRNAFELFGLAAIEVAFESFLLIRNGVFMMLDRCWMVQSHLWSGEMA